MSAEDVTPAQVEEGNADAEAEEPKKETRRHSFYSAVPLARRMQEGAWGTFQTRGRRSLERLKNRVSSRFLGKPINLYFSISAVIVAIIATIVYVEVFLRPNWQTAAEVLAEQELEAQQDIATTVAYEDVYDYYNEYLFD